ncbi:MAG TPA: tetratricopeptide repeat protein [Candidatus Limnocylindrales bacterium]
MHLHQVLEARRPPRAAGVVLAAALIVAGTYATTLPRTAPPSNGATSPAGEPPTIQQIDTGAAPVDSVAQIDHSIEAWSKNLAANPHDFLAATNIAVLYQGRGRLSSDLGDYERSLEAARTALSIEPGHVPARLAEASTLVSLHAFDAALAVADSVLADHPTEVAAVAVRFDAELELGRVDDARTDLAALESTGGPAVLVREARLASVTGEPARALELATAARSAAIADEAESIGFYEYAVGEYARLAGDAATARTAFAAALADRPDDIGALVGLARIDAFEGRVDAAINGLRHATRIAPQPEALALLGDLLVSADAADTEAAKAFDTIRFIERLGDVQASTFDRQLLRFEVDHDGADEALLARVRASVDDRPDAAGHDLLAWTLYRLGRYAEAAASIADARALGADDARLRLHDGAIRLALGDSAAGRELLQSALDLGPALDPAERAEAETVLTD